MMRPGRGTDGRSGARHDALAEQQFGPLSEAERKLLGKAPSGKDAKCGPEGAGRDSPENDPGNPHTWGQDRTIRSALLRWLC
jgi:hypothetical protein